MEIRDRIQSLKRVRAGDLRPNPKNWRVHPESQQNAVRGILAEVGYVDALLVRETSAGLEIIDGHLRAETTPDAMVPVLVVDLAQLVAANHHGFLLARFEERILGLCLQAAEMERLLEQIDHDPQRLMTAYGVARHWRRLLDDQLEK